MGFDREPYHLADCWRLVSIFDFFHIDWSDSCPFRWEWPPAVCGSHTNPMSLQRSKRWCMTSYQIFNKLQKMSSADIHGVRTRVANFFFDKPLEDDAEEWEKMEEIKSAEVSQSIA